MKTTKRTDSEKALSIIREGETVAIDYGNQKTNLTVKAYGHTYRILDAYGKHPVIEQVE